MDKTDCGSLFHSVGEAIAKPRLPMSFLGQNEEKDSQFSFLNGHQQWIKLQQSGNKSWKYELTETHLDKRE